MVRSYVGAASEAGWWLQATPALAGLGVLIVTREKIKLTSFIYMLIWFLAVVLLTGAHYRYGEVPVARWFMNSFNWAGNLYYFFEYFTEGTVLALLFRELLLRVRNMKRGSGLFAASTLCSLALSVAVAALQWAAGLPIGSAGLSLAALCALAGAVAGLLTLWPLHDRVLRKIWKSKIGPVRWIDIVA